MSTSQASTAQAAVAVSALAQSIGVNTHIDFSWTPYANLAAVQSALAYLGVTTVRDAIDAPSDLAEFAQLNQDLGVHFDFFIAPGSVGMPWQLQQIESDPAIVRFVEGPNESDNWPQSYNGLTGMAATVAEQNALALSVRAELPGVPVIAPSFGQLASYARVGNLSGSADYANAHIYFGTGNNPAADGWIQTLMQDAELVAPGKPVITTETGYYTTTSVADPSAVDPIVQAKYLLDDVLDQFKAGVKMDFLYELVDQGTDPTNPEDHFGLFNTDWTAKPAAVAIHDLMTLLNDPGAGSPGAVQPGSLTYSLSGMPSTAQSLLLQKSDGTFVLAVWNDVRLSGPITSTDIAVASVPVTLSLASPAAKIVVFDPLLGTTQIATASNASQIVVSLPDHPILIEIGPNAGAIAPLPAAPAAPAPIPTQPTGVTVTVPTGISAQVGQTVAISGVQVADPWAAGTSGGMLLNLSAASGRLILTDAGGNPVAGSGSFSISITETLFQINTDLAHLSYVAPASGASDTITVDVWDPAGLEATRTIAVAVTQPPPQAPSPSVGPAIALPATESVAAGASVAIAPVTITDAFAADNPGTMVLNLSAAVGHLTMTDALGTALTGSGTGSISVTGTLSVLNTDLSHLTYSAPTAGGPDTITVNVWDQAGLEAMQTIAVTVSTPTASTPAAPVTTTPPPTTTPTAPPSTDPSVVVPTAETVTVSTSTTITGVSIIDTFAAANPGTLALNLGTGTGTLAMTDSTGAKLPGSGTTALSINGTLAQLNADLGRLIYSAGAAAGSDALSLDVWDQAGRELTASIPITLLAAASPTLAASVSTTGTGSAVSAPPATSTYDSLAPASGGTAMSSSLSTTLVGMAPQTSTLSGF